MKTQITFVAILMALLMGATTVSAQENEDATSTHDGVRAEKMEARTAERAEMKAEREAKMEERTAERTEMKAEREEKMEERKAALDEKRKERIAEHAARMIERMNAAVTRIEKLADRVESRIAKFTDKGVDTTAALALLATAEEKIAEAKTLIATTEASIATALEGEDPKAAFSEIRTSIKGIIENIKGAHLSLVEVIKELKGKVEKDEETEEEEEGEETEDETDEDTATTTDTEA